MARPTKCLIDTKALRYNFDSVKNAVKDKKVLVLVKADAYGHGLVEVAKILSDADYFGVATLEEAETLRNNGIKNSILCLDPLPYESEELAVKYDVEQAVSTEEAVIRLENEGAKENKIVNVHIKIETGMHRTGVTAGEKLDSLLKTVKKCEHINVSGVFTHFFESDNIDSNSTDIQASRFFEAVKQIKEFGYGDITVHCANSGGILSYPDYYCDMVRAGIIIYGLYPSDNTKHPFEPKPVMSLVSKIVSVSEVKKGETIGYSATYTAQRDMKIAILPIGYGDGYRRALSNKGYVLIDGKKANIVGNICMDMTAVDITDIPNAQIGSDAVLVGKQGELEITADDIAEIYGTINYEVALSLNKRVPKEYV